MCWVTMIDPVTLTILGLVVSGATVLILAFAIAPNLVDRVQAAYRAHRYASRTIIAAMNPLASLGILDFFAANQDLTADTHHTTDIVHLGRTVQLPRSGTYVSVEPGLQITTVTNDAGVLVGWQLLFHKSAVARRAANTWTQRHTRADMDAGRHAAAVAATMPDAPVQEEEEGEGVQLLSMHS